MEYSIQQVSSPFLKLIYWKQKARQMGKRKDLGDLDQGQIVMDRLLVQNKTAK